MHEDISIYAFNHEMKHMRYDEAHGWLGFRSFRNPVHLITSELEAYNYEVDAALSHGRKDVARKLYKAFEKDMKERPGHWSLFKKEFKADYEMLLKKVM